MPELPEVETIRRGLRRRIVGKKIAGFTVGNIRVLRGQSRAWVQRALVGQVFSDVKRRGKLLFLPIRGQERSLLIHLKMTGQLIYAHDERIVAGGHGWPAVVDLPNKYTHVTLTFADGSRLYFNDLRQFGYFKIAGPQELKRILNAFGPELVGSRMTFAEFWQRLCRRKLSLKAALLNQAVFAGIGNIYADEICFAAGLKPHRPIATLTLAEGKRLFAACQRILQLAIKHRGTTFRTYQDSDGRRGNFVRLLKVYGRGGKACLTCDTLLTRTRFAGRGTVYCAQCQR
jgi:formamidopyrimidine-DNA glycosylase